MMNLGNHIEAVKGELARAREAFPRPFASSFEGRGIIEEELDELWEEVRAKQGGGRNVARMRKEAIQVGAMLWRFLEDTCGMLNKHVEIAADYNVQLHSPHEGYIVIRDNVRAMASILDRKSAALLALRSVLSFLRDCCDSEEAGQR